MIDRDIRDAILDIIDLIRDKYIPSSQISAYYQCDVALQDYVGEDLFDYYGELQKLMLANYGVTAAIRMLPSNKNVVPLESDTTYLGVLDDDEFADSGFEKPVRTVEGQYLYYPIQTGDTLQRIALKIYGSYELYTYIEQENNIRNNDLIDNDMTGVILRIPILEETDLRNEYNIVYETFNYGDTDSMKKYYLGQDISLIDGKMIIDARGDIKIAEPVDGVVQNINDRLNHETGSLNPLHPDWGVSSVQSYSGLPYDVAIKKYYADVVAQIKSDPRVGDVTLNEKKTYVMGDALYLDVNVSLITGDNVVIQTGVR